MDSKTMRLTEKILIIAVSFVVAIAMMPTAVHAAGNMKVEWFNVGAGDSMFMRLPGGRTVLIDGGTVSKGYTVVSKLKNMNVHTIDYCISSHPDADHVGGLEAVFSELHVKHFYYPHDTKYSTQTAKKVIRLAKAESGCRLYNPKRGSKIKDGGATLTFVQSSKDYSTDNEDSLALFINYGKLQILTCGDNEDGSEEAITRENVDILQLPHHGSKYATSYNFIKRFDPEEVVVSTDGHKYGHPNKEVFLRCKKYDSKIKVWRTDKKGDIVVNATKSKWNFTKKGDALGKYANGLH